MTAKSVKVGIIGCGAISPLYFQAGRVFEILDIAACADILPDRAQVRAEQFGCTACTVDELLADPQIEIVVNLTLPATHAEVSFAVLEAGKHLYSEKPLATTRDDAQKIMEMAQARGVEVGCAPDTFMGGGIQTCIKLIDDGFIGTPLAATAFMMGPGPEQWHPDAEFYYKKGVGPMMDMGPYYLTALVSMMGPVRRATGSAQITRPFRQFPVGPKAGTSVEVEVPTHIVGVMDFESGVVGTIITSCDVWGCQLPRIEVYGTEGAISVPDPNTFGGPVKALKAGGGWEDVQLSHGYTEQMRGIGIADMAYAIRSGRPLRAAGEMAYHILDVMLAFHDASEEDRHILVRSTCNRPAPLPVGLEQGKLDG